MRSINSRPHVAVPILTILAACASAAAQSTPPASPPAPGARPPAGEAEAMVPGGASSPTSSLMADTAGVETADGRAVAPHALRNWSLFAVATPEPRTIQAHDLVQIIVRETSRAKSKHELDAEKSWSLDGSIDSFPAFMLPDLLELQLRNSDPDNFPIDLGVNFDKEFEGEGEYKREDDLTARLTAEVIEVQPNGNLVLEARTSIRNDEELLTIKVTGICRQDDVTALNTILSNQIHDLRIDKTHTGELKKANEKGIIAKVLDAIFAF